MNDHDKARPVSGEIMTGTAPAREPVQPADISDAEYETVGSAARAPHPATVETPAVAGMESLRAGAAPAFETTSRQPAGPLFWAFGLTLVILAFWISGGDALVRQVGFSLPSAAPSDPLVIGEVRSRVERHGGRDILFVEGQAENHGNANELLPPIEIIVTAEDGSSQRYLLGTKDADLKPGDRYSFSSRLEAPRNGVKSVSVAFREGNR